jgi:hypothetical protein
MARSKRLRSASSKVSMCEIGISWRIAQEKHSCIFLSLIEMDCRGYLAGFMSNMLSTRHRQIGRCGVTFASAVCFGRIARGRWDSKVHPFKRPISKWT